MSIRAGEMAERLGVTRMHVARMAQAELIPGARRTKGGHRYWLETESLSQWLKAIRLSGKSGNSTLWKACLRHHKKNRAATAALMTRYNETHRHFKAEASAAADYLLKAINARRTMGIMLKELLGRERVTRTCLRYWLRENPGQLGVENVDWLMDCVRVYNQLPEGQLERLCDAPWEVVEISLKSPSAVQPGILLNS